MTRSRFLFLSIVVLAVTLIIGGTGAGVVRHILARQIPANQTQYYYLEPGSSLLRAAYLAKKHRLVAARWHFTVAARTLGLEHQLQAGEYELSPGLSLEKILLKISRGERYFRRIVVPEGLSAREIEILLRDTFGLDTSDLLKLEEGTLLPDTYFYERGDKATAVVERMKSKQSSFLASIWDTRVPSLPFDTIQEALILASIVEKETAQASERSMVAAVFINRLKKGMRLQSDPTVIYGITNGLPLGRAISGSDLKATTPYNTYRIKGMPPAPIANPGREAIRAVLHPADVPYLYFVADGSGGHAFANTLNDHNRNVARWRQIERKSRN
ncbi:endolytic transglycosylase MltG [Kordiimonas sp.]|uniref:endolytic transglycosylase MltG n=1 Tax=Kordiimonas sp. TaxID=1970157 RepID=UPI003A94C1A8